MTKENLDIEIKRVKKASSMRLKIGKNGKPILTIPFWIPQKIGLMWAQKQQQWIQNNTFVPKYFCEEEEILFLGNKITIKHTEERTQTHLKDGILWVSGRKEFLQRRVADFIKKEFLIYLRPLLEEKEKALGVKHSRITLRDTTSRWGSCSSTKGLNFCWRLAMTPDFVIDYLVAHEVAHLTHMNHSPDFWKTVAKLTPYTYQAKKWLKENAKEIPILK